MFNMFKKIEKKGIYIETPSPLNLEYRKKVSFLKDDYTIRYSNKFIKDMEYRFKTNLLEMTNEDLILFAVKFLGADKEYLYYYIYNDKTVIGEIYAYSSFQKNDYFFFIYLDKEYRTQENYISAFKEFENEMYSPFIEARRLYIDTEFFEFDEALEKSNFKLETVFHDNNKRYICKEYMAQGMHLEVPDLKHEEMFRSYLKYNGNLNYNFMDYKKWLKDIEKDSKNMKKYFLMFYNNSLKEYEIVGVGHVLNNWKKINCIEYEIEKERRDTDFGKYFLDMLFDELDENAEFITLTCESKDKYKIKEYNEVLGYLIDKTYQKNNLMYFELSIIVY